eukprot:8103873-Pyramimonas_sp.AAC.2
MFTLNQSHSAPNPACSAVVQPNIPRKKDTTRVYKSSSPSHYVLKLTNRGTVKIEGEIRYKRSYATQQLQPWQIRVYNPNLFCSCPRR